MQVEVVVPQIGEAVAELTLTAWLKSVGDTVRKGDVLFEIDSDKAIIEVEAFVEGTLTQILATEGSSVLPQAVVALVETETSAIPSNNPAPSEIGADGMKANGRKASPLAQRIANDLGVNLEKIPGSGPAGRIMLEDVRQFARPGSIDITHPVNASPKARALAKSLQIDLHSVQGTGVNGMIGVADVEALQARQVVEPSAPEVSAGAIVQPPPSQATSRLRQIIASRTQLSKNTVPHFYLMVDVDMTEVNRLRTYCREQLRWEKMPTYTDILLRACALALLDVPAAMVNYGETGLTHREGIHVGVAVNTEEGVIIPVVSNIARLNLRQVSGELREAAQRAREGRLKPADMGEKRMVISNLGMYKVDAFVAIIDMPDPMILAVGRVKEQVVPLNGTAAIRPMCTLTLSVDHRALDGVQGAQFLERVALHLENPYQILGQEAR